MTGTGKGRRYSKDQIDAIKDKVGLVDTIKAAGVKLQQKGPDHFGVCPFHAEKTGSFSVNEKKGFYHCFGCQAHGTVIDFVMEFYNLDFPNAMKRLGGEADLQDDEEIERRARRRRIQEAEQREADRAKAAKRRRSDIEEWRHAVKLPAKALGNVNGLPGDLVERYLASRGYVFGSGRPFPPSLRFVPSLRYWFDGDPKSGAMLPAMVGYMQIYDPEKDEGRADPFHALHRTYLRPDGSGKADVEQPKLIFTRYKGAAVRFTPAGPRLGVTEGIETALGVLFSGAMGERLDAVWAAGFMGNMAALKLPPAVREVVLLMDNDMKSHRNAERTLDNAARHYGAARVRVSIAEPPRGMDFDDLHQRAPSGAASAAVDAGNAWAAFREGKG